MNINTIWHSWNCGEAFKFYEKCLGGKAEMMKYGDSPMADQTPEGLRTRSCTPGCRLAIRY